MFLVKFFIITFTFSFFGFEDNTADVKMSNDVLELVNKIRKQGCNCGNTYYPAVNELKWNNQLAQAAALHSNDMNQNNFFNHKGTKGNIVGDRVMEVGYNWLSTGENIAKNQPNAEIVVASWLKSEGHCKNIMSPNYDEMGVAKVGAYWTQVFGTK